MHAQPSANRTRLASGVARMCPFDVAPLAPWQLLYIFVCMMRSRASARVCECVFVSVCWHTNQPALNDRRSAHNLGARARTHFCHSREAFARALARLHILHNIFGTMVRAFRSEQSTLNERGTLQCNLGDCPPASAKEGKRVTMRCASAIDDAINVLQIN